MKSHLAENVQIAHPRYHLSSDDGLYRPIPFLFVSPRMRDDILDVEGDAATLGKTAGKDTQSNKPTYVSALGLEAARQLAGRLRGEAREAIAPLGEAGHRLAGLADLIVLRKS